MKSMIVIFLVLSSFNVFSQEDSRLFVVRAQWGDKDITENAKAKCAGSHSCHFQLTKEDFGRTQGRDKKFEIEWACSGVEGLQSRSFSEKKKNEFVDIQCESTGDVTGKGEYIYSLRNAVLGKFDNKLRGSFGEECIKSLEKFYASGKRLFSQGIKSRLSTVDNLVKGDYANPSKTFYHYTNSSEVLDIGRSNETSRFFSFLRTNKANAWDAVMYVAGDPESSRTYGNIQLKVFLKNSAVILDEYNEAYSSHPSNIYEEITAKEESLKVCPFYSLYQLAAEDMGVDVIHYSNYVSQTWIQVLNPSVVDHLEIGKVK